MNNVTLITVQANDSDKGPNGVVRYRLASSNGDHNNFMIDPVTGALRNLNPLDREKQDKYQFFVYAYDLGEKSLSTAVTIRVLILDTDDHPPTFPVDKKVQELTVSENAEQNDTMPDGSKGTFVGQIGSATDQDTGNNSQICYFIVSGEFARTLM